MDSDMNSVFIIERLGSNNLEAYTQIYSKHWVVVISKEIWKLILRDYLK